MTTSSKLSAEERLRRLLSAVPWIVDEEGPSVSDVCARFGYTEEELVDDLNLLFVCGVYPFTPDTLMEADVVDGRVWIHYADFFGRPLKLTPAEGLAVLAAGQALLSVPGADDNGTLGRALDKLASVLGVDPDESLEVELGEAPSETLELFRTATKEHRAVTMEYYTYGRDTWSKRSIEPWQIFSSAGQWYVKGLDRDRKAERIFRLDRVRDPQLNSDRFDPPENSESTDLYSPQSSDRLITLDLPQEAWWVAEQYPVESIEQIDESIRRIELYVGEQAWLERLLLRLGASVKSKGADGVAQQAAQRILKRYR